MRMARPLRLLHSSSLPSRLVMLLLFRWIGLAGWVESPPTARHARVARVRRSIEQAGNTYRDF